MPLKMQSAKTMRIKQALDLLEYYNKWRQDNGGNYEMPNPKDITIALNVVIEFSKNKLAQ